jgi:hypothetical protein
MNKAHLPLAFALMFLAAGSHAQSVFDGTWKADLDKNKRLEKPDVWLLEAGEYACRSCDPPYHIKADGRDYAVPGSAMYDTLSIAVVDEHTILKVAKKAGSVVAKVTASVSADGGTQTVNQKISLPDREPFEITQQFSRVGAAPNGSHAISGSWQQIQTQGSDNVDVTTFKVTGNMLSMSSKTGESYMASLDGSDTPFKGRPGVTSVSVKKIDDHTIEETWKNAGTVVMTARWWVESDGHTMHARFDDQKGSVFEQTGHKVQ